MTQEARKTSNIAPHLPSDLGERAEFFAAAMSMFMSRYHNAVLPEVLYFMNPDQVLTFISTFGGTQVRVPTMKEFGEDLLASLAVFWMEVRGETPEQVQARLGLTPSRWASIQSSISTWREFVKDEPILARARMKAM